MEAAGVFLHIGDLRGVPLPVTLFLYGAANVVVLSFVPAALFSDERRRSRPTATSRNRPAWLTRVARSNALRAVASTIGVLWLSVVIGDGVVGPQDPGQNVVEQLTWAVLWVVLLPLAALLANLWRPLNPWTALHRFLFPGGGQPARSPLPPGLGTWPASIALFGFAVLGLACWPAIQPSTIALLLLAYTVVTLLGMVACGRDEWLGRCEGLTALFAAVSSLAPIQTTWEETGGVREVRLRPLGAALLDQRPVGWDRVMPIVLLLAALLFMGLPGRDTWQTVSGMVTASGVRGPGATALSSTVGLLVMVLLVLLAFVIVARFTGVLIDVRRGDRATTIIGGLTVPIAVLFSLALGCGTLFPRLQAAVPALPLRSDVIWFAQLTLLMLGHASAVDLVNRWATSRFRGVRRAMLAQYPVVVLLVACTMAGMLILAQPPVSMQ